MCAYVYVGTHYHAHIPHTITRIYMQSVCMQISIHMHTHMHACIGTNMYGRICTYTHNHLDTCTQTRWLDKHVDITNTLTYAHNKAGNTDPRSGHNASCHIHEWVTPRTQVSHVTRIIPKVWPPKGAAGWPSNPDNLVVLDCFAPCLPTCVT